MDSLKCNDDKTASLIYQPQAKKYEMVLLITINQKGKTLQKKEKEIDILSNYLRRILVNNKTDVLECLAKAEKSMQDMVSKQIALQNMLTEKTKGLHSLLLTCEIFMPVVNNKIENSKEEEKKLKTMIIPKMKKAKMRMLQ
jgi:hypothetical protein